MVTLGAVPGSEALAASYVTLEPFLNTTLIRHVLDVLRGALPQVAGTDVIFSANFVCCCRAQATAAAATTTDAPSKAAAPPAAIFTPGSAPGPGTGALAVITEAVAGVAAPLVRRAAAIADQLDTQELGLLASALHRGKYAEGKINEWSPCGRQFP